ncbi:MAG: VanZ family protein [Acidobacteriota bacterium]
MRNRLKLWVLPVLWMMLVFSFSTEPFAVKNTTPVFRSLLGWLVPGISPATHEFLHYLLRKLGHWAEYSVLGWLWARALVGEAAGKNDWILWSLILVGICGLLDEQLQMRIPGRNGVLADSLLDFGGGAFGVVWFWVWWNNKAGRSRQGKPLPTGSAKSV